MWFQPYEHNEPYVQTRSRDPPPNPDYTQLIQRAGQVARDGLVLMVAADFDYREIAVNWVKHAQALGHTNTLILSMDRELSAHLSQMGITHADNSANLAAWNQTCLQRHIQAVRMERHLAVAALVSNNYDVLLCDATAVFIRDPVPFLLQQSVEADVLFQREDWPSGPAMSGLAVNTGFILFRSRNGEEVANLIREAVDRGLIEFYLRWNNICDQYGYSYVLAGSAAEVETREFSNETTFGYLKRRHCARNGTCLRFGLLPYDRFPRHHLQGTEFRQWARLSQTALIHHMTIACAEEAAPCTTFGVRPFRGNRQRLDRYDDSDFDDMVQALREAGAWKIH